MEDITVTIEITNTDHGIHELAKMLNEFLSNTLAVEATVAVKLKEPDWD